MAESNFSDYSLNTSDPTGMDSLCTLNDRRMARLDRIQREDPLGLDGATDFSCYSSYINW